MIHSFLCPLSPPSRLHSRSEEDDQTITKRETIVVSLLFTIHIYVSISSLFDGVHCCIVCCRAQCTFLRFFSITLMYTHTHTHTRMHTYIWNMFSGKIFLNDPFYISIRWLLLLFLSNALKFFTSICFIISTSSSWTHLELKSIKQVDAGYGARIV